MLSLKHLTLPIPHVTYRDILGCKGDKLQKHDNKHAIKLAC